MAKPKKTAKKTVRARPATTRPAPPAAAPRKGGAPAGGVLVWTQHGSDTWLAPDPEGDASRAGGRIKKISQGWLEKNQPLHFVYRDGEYLGSDPTLEAAQRRAQYREKSEKILSDRMHGPDGLPAFLAATTEERRKTRPAHVPQQVDALKRAPPPDDPVLAKAIAARTDLATEKSARKAEKRATAKNSAFDDDAVITVTADKNPRKPGTGAFARFALLMEYSGKTIGTFKAAKGNLETLENAIKAGRASIKGEE